MELTRSFMALFANAHRDPKRQPTPYKPQDFFKLSYDTQLVREHDPELFSKVAKRLGGSIKGKKESGSE